MAGKDKDKKVVEGKIVPKDSGPRSEGTSSRNTNSNKGVHITQWRAGLGSV